MSAPYLKRCDIEVGRPRRGRPSYAWVEAYIVVRADGTEEHPPRRTREANKRLRELQRGKR